MGLNSVHDRFLEVVRSRLHSQNVANRLTDILCIGKEAVYRRLRGEVSFTLEEIAAITLDLGISLDDVVGSSNHVNNRSFQLKTTSFVNPTPDDLFQMREWVSILSQVVQIPDLELGELGNAFDFTLFYPYQYLSRFVHFKWQYQRKGRENALSFNDISFFGEHAELQSKHTSLSRTIAKTIYIWDPLIFQYFVTDICYFRDIDILDENDVEQIKSDLLDFADWLESIARRGCYETGSQVQFYVSHTNIETTYTYYQGGLFNLALVRTFTLNAMASLNSKTTQEIKGWVLAQKRQATLISESGEMQRIAFFKKQKELINNLL